MKNVWILMVCVVALAGCGTTAAEPDPPTAQAATLTLAAATVRPTVSFTPTVAVAPSPPATGAVASASLGKLAFVRDGNLWVKDVASGQERQLTQSGDMAGPTWSPSGGWVSAHQLDASGQPSSLHTIEVATGSNVELSSASVGSGVWSPTDDRLAFITSAGATIVSPDGSNPVNLPDASSIAWSTDGTQLACARTRAAGGGVWVVDADGSHAREVQPADQSGATLLLADWSTDDADLLGWSDPLGSASIAADGLPLEAIGMNDGAAVELTQAMLPHGDLLDLSRAEDSRIAASVGAGRSTVNQKGIAVGDVSGGLHSVSPQDRAELYPAWSADGQWLALTSGPAAPGSSAGGADDQAIAARRVWLMHPDGSDRHQAVGGATVRQERAEWSADSRMLLWIEPGAEAHFRLVLDQREGNDQPAVVADGLGASGFDPSGVYGYVDWSQLYAWWQPTFDPASAEAAEQVVQDYYAALAARDYVPAYQLWADNGQASRQSLEQFAAGYAHTTDVQAHAGRPGQVGAAAGSRYVEVPVEVFARTAAGAQHHFEGTLTLRRSVVPGATLEQRRWRIYTADVHQIA